MTRRKYLLAGIAAFSLFSQRASQENESGIGLVEVILAFGVSVVVIVALVSLATFTLRAATTSSRMMQGTRLANQEIETVRALRDYYGNSSDLTWDDFLNAVSVCEPVTEGSACGVGSCHATLSPTPAILPVNREVDEIQVCFGAQEVLLPGGDSDSSRVGIVAVATWTIGGERKYVHNYTRLADWVR